ncbi:MAG: septum site-determining protein MinC [Synergistaceae bacterium]|jgi:septum site-determining protein MinC|nr:septum site-determining protein MinC [Synergistaceae bacterium]
MIKLKGMSGSIVRCVIPEDLPAADFKSAFDKVMEDGGSILNGARMVLDFGARAISETAVTALLSEFVWPSGASVVAWITYDAVSQELLKRAGLGTSEPAPSEGGSRSALVLHRSLRSGQRVEHRGDVIISGHVNDGAEVLASGNITVLGRLNGLVHAGYEGEDEGSDSVVVSRCMEALQVRIGSKIGSLGRDAEWWGKRVIVSVKDGAVLIEYWPFVKGENAKEETV